MLKGKTIRYYTCGTNIDKRFIKPNFFYKKSKTGSMPAFQPIGSLHIWDFMSEGDIKHKGGNPPLKLPLAC